MTSCVYICCICVGYSTHFIFPTVNCVCQTSAVVPAVPAVSYHVVNMWHAIVSQCDIMLVCAYVCGIPTFSTQETQ
jgi:hypothetical protein